MARPLKNFFAALVGDLFFNFTLLSVAELPGYTLSYLGMTFWGRKVMLLLLTNTPFVMGSLAECSSLYSKVHAVLDC